MVPERQLSEEKGQYMTLPHNEHSCTVQVVGDDGGSSVVSSSDTRCDDQFHPSLLDLEAHWIIVGIVECCHCRSNKFASSFRVMSLK